MWGGCKYGDLADYESESAQILFVALHPRCLVPK